MKNQSWQVPTYKAGVPMLAGTDVLNPYCLPGFSLHDELIYLVQQAGLTPLDALRLATLNPGRFLGAVDSLGTIAPNKLADLVLLDADPLLDVKNTTRISAVIANGRLYDRSRLDALLSAAEKFAASRRQRDRQVGVPRHPCRRAAKLANYPRSQELRPRLRAHHDQRLYFAQANRVLRDS